MSFHSDTIMLASMVVHLAEHIETGDMTDLEAAKGIAVTPSIKQLFRDLADGGMIPVTRKEVLFITEILKE